MESNTRSIYAEIRIDWEDYDDVMDELVLEDAIESVKDGVDIYIVPNYSTLIREHQLMKEALEAIQKGQGEYSLDQCKHAENVIKNQIEIATETLKQITL